MGTSRKASGSSGYSPSPSYTIFKNTIVRPGLDNLLVLQIYQSLVLWGIILPQRCGQTITLKQNEDTENRILCNARLSMCNIDTGDSVRCRVLIAFYETICQLIAL